MDGGLCAFSGAFPQKEHMPLRVMQRNVCVGNTSPGSPSGYVLVPSRSWLMTCLQEEGSSKHRCCRLRRTRIPCGRRRGLFGIDKHLGHFRLKEDFLVVHILWLIQSARAAQCERLS